jgi:hypothetical protein
MLHVSDIARRDDGLQVHGAIGGRPFRFAYSLGAPPAGEAADAAVAACLIPAMRAGTVLRVDEPVSPRLLHSVGTVQDILVNWRQRFAVYGRYGRVRVEAPAREAPADTSGRGVAAFFTGGVDSFYTLLRHRDEIDTLILVHGFDYPSDGPLRERITAALRECAAELGKPLTEVTTDVRKFSDPLAFWESYHGSALATTGLLLGFEKIYVPATQTYAHMAPLGSHPLLDPLWSTENVEFVHDGCEADRLEKLAIIASAPAARRFLRVCWENRDGRYNCGECEKCLRTTIALQALGLLGEFSTLPDRLDPAAIRRVDLPELTHTWDASLALLEQSPEHAELARSVRQNMFGTTARAARRVHHYRRRILGR